MKILFRFIFLSISILISELTFAQTLYPVQKEGKWGAIDAGGTIMIDPTYEFVSEFQKDGTAMVRQEGLYGLINAKGELLLEPQYERIDPLQEGYLAVWKNYKVALASRSNQLLTEPVYDVITPIYANFLRVVQGTKFGVINLKGETVLPIEYDKVDAFKKGSYYTYTTKGDKKGILSYDGSILAEAKYTKIEKQGSYLVASITRGGYSVTFLDEEGKPTETKEFPNQVAWQQYKKALESRNRKRILSKNPDARAPRWVKVDYRFALQDGAGRNLLGPDQLFYNVSADSVTGLSMGKVDDAENKTTTFLIDDKNAKVLFSTPAKDLSLIDYRYGNYARITIDTLWDGMVNREGVVIEELSSSGENFPITDIGGFNDGLAWFKTVNRYGFVNTDGNVMIPPKYQVVSDFQEGYAIAKLNTIFGALDTSGKTVIPFEYDGIAPPQEGLFRVKKGNGAKGRWGVVNLQNKLVIPYGFQAIGDFVNGEATIVQNGKFGLISKTGKVLIPTIIEVEKMDPFENGIAWVGRGRDVQEVAGEIRIIYTKQGYVTRTGSFIIPPNFEHIEDFPKIWKAQKGLCLVRKEGRVGYFDYKGNAVLPTLYYFVDDFEKIWKENKGITKVSNDELFGYVNHHGQEVTPVLFDEISEAFETIWKDSSGIALAKKDGKYGYMNYKAIAEIPFAYDALTEFREGVALAKRDGKWGAINLKNETVIPFVHDGLRFLPKTEKAIIQFLSRKEKSYDVNGEGQIYEPDLVAVKQRFAGKFTRSDKYEYAWTSPLLGVGVVKSKEQQALIDGDGKLITKFDFREIRAFVDGLAVAQKEAKKVLERRWGFIDTKGNWVVEPIYQKATDFSEGKAAVMLRQKWGYVDKTGRLAIPNKFRSAEAFQGGFAIVEGTQIINEKGENLGAFQLEGKITEGFISERAVVEDIKGFYHIKPNGSPAYFQRHDAVTRFIGNVAFAKRGELWELTRRSGQKGDFLSKVRFTRGKRNEYLKLYGNNRTKELGPGNAMMDIGWEKIQEGSWKMIGKDGTVLTLVTFKDVKVKDENTFNVVIDRMYGLLDKEGNPLTEGSYELIKSIDDTIVRLESAGEISYFDMNTNKWIWK